MSNKVEVQTKPASQLIDYNPPTWEMVFNTRDQMMVSALFSAEEKLAFMNKVVPGWEELAIGEAVENEGQLADSLTRSLMNVGSDYVYYVVAAHMAGQKTPPTFVEVDTLIEERLGGYPHSFRRYVSDMVEFDKEVASKIGALTGEMDLRPALAYQVLKAPHYKKVFDLLQKMETNSGKK